MPQVALRGMVSERRLEKWLRITLFFRASLQKRITPEMADQKLFDLYVASTMIRCGRNFCAPVHNEINIYTLAYYSFTEPSRPGDFKLISPR